MPRNNQAQSNPTTETNAEPQHIDQPTTAPQREYHGLIGFVKWYIASMRSEENGDSDDESLKRIVKTITQATIGAIEFAVVGFIVLELVVLFVILVYEFCIKKLCLLTIMSSIFYVGILLASVGLLILIVPAMNKFKRKIDAIKTVDTTISLAVLLLTIVGVTSAIAYFWFQIFLIALQL